MKRDRMRGTGIIILIVGLFVVLQFSHAMPVEEKEKDNFMFLADSNSQFAVELYKQVKGKEGNLFISPFSISTALAMTYGGARGNTEKQMAQVLHFDIDQKVVHAAFSDLLSHINSLQEKGVIQLHSANSAWLQKKFAFNPDYLSLVKDSYGSVLRNVDFKKPEKARKTINTWVEGQTKNKIKELIKKGLIDKLTRLVLTNAIYFKGTWASRFDTASTHDSPFYIATEDTVLVPMMYQKRKFRYTSDSLCQILEMPYKDDAVSMLFVLPRERDGLAEIEDRLHVDSIKGWTTGLREQKVNVYIPRITMTSDFLLSKTLSSMGMPEAFSKKADFSGITKKTEVYISEVAHKAFIELNEEGTEAAAATAVLVREYSAEEVPVFMANHPFLLFIRENKSGSILFIGRVVNPKI